jgi:hypothetical protein
MVLRQSELLKLMGIVEADQIPMKTDSFYSYAGVFAIRKMLANENGDLRMNYLTCESRTRNYPQRSTAA